MPDPSDVPPIQTIPITVSEEATATVVTVAPIGSPEKTTTIVKVDESDKELPELQIAEDTPASTDIKEKENKKPGVKVIFKFAFNLLLMNFCLQNIFDIFLGPN